MLVSYCCYARTYCVDQGPGQGWARPVFLKTRRFEASFRREMGNDTEFEASFRRKMGNNTNLRRVFWREKGNDTIQGTSFYTKNEKNREKTGKTGGKTLKNRKKKTWKKQEKTLKNWKKQEKKKTENYKKYRNEFLTRFREMLKTETSLETSSGTSLETSSETSSRSSQMSRNNDSRAKTIHRPTPSPGDWSCNWTPCYLTPSVLLSCVLLFHQLPFAYIWVTTAWMHIVSKTGHI